MKVVSEGFQQKAENSFGVKYEPKLVVDGQEITEGIQSFKYSALVNPDGAFSFGNTCCASVSFSIEQSQVNLLGKEIEVYQGLEVNGEMEYVLLGRFEVLKRKEEKGTYLYECYDYMGTRMETLYSRFAVGMQTTDIVLLQNICESVGISLEKEDELVSHTLDFRLGGYTKREIIGYIAQLQGKNAIINANGNLELVWYQDTGFVVDDEKIYLDGADSINDATDYTLEYLKCVKKDDFEETVELTSGTGTVGITFENPFMTQEILDEVYDKLAGFSFRAVEVEFLGDFRLEIGDIVQVNTNGGTYTIPIMQLEHNSDGGVITTIQSVAETDGENQIDTSGPSSKKMDRYYAELVLINKAVVDKLSAEEADVRYLKTEEMDVITANIENAVVENLEANFASIEKMDAANARIEDLEANALTADSVQIKELQADVADVTTLMFGAAGGTSIQSEFSNAVVAQIGEAQIQSAMIEEVSASKIAAGDIITNNVRVKSENGSIILSDETMQISDENRVRVQIGKDASGDYSINVWDIDGNLMFSKGGLTESAIKDAIIRNEMISDTANIDAGKLDIGSLFEKINEDGSHTLKSSKILLDEEKQTLNIAFQSMKNNVESLEEIQSSQGTQISAIQGQISSKVWQQDINTAVDEVEGDISTLTTQYSSLNQTVNGISSTVSTHTTSINSLGTRMSSAESSITQHSDLIVTKVSKDGVISSINQSAETIQISASKVNLVGAVTFTSLDSSTQSQINTAINNSSSAVNTANSAKSTADSAASTASTANTNASSALTKANTANSNASAALTAANNAEKKYGYTIDLSNTTTYNVDTYYPVVGTALPAGGYHKLSIAVQLNSGTKPSWSTHTNGFSCNLAIRVKAFGWGTVNDKLGWIDDNSYAFCDKMPAYFQQMTNSSLPVFYLRGGGKYFLYADYSSAWTPKTTTYTVNSQSVAPTTSPSNWSYLANSWQMNTAIANWCYNNDVTYINGANIYTGTISAKQIDVSDLFAQNITASGLISNTASDGSYLKIDMASMMIESTDASAVVLPDLSDYYTMRSYYPLSWQTFSTENVGGIANLGCPYMKLDNGILILNNTTYDSVGIKFGTARKLSLTGNGVYTPNLSTDGIACKGTVSCNNVATGALNVGTISASAAVTVKGAFTAASVKTSAGADLDTVNSKLIPVADSTYPSIYKTGRYVTWHIDSVFGSDFASSIPSAYKPPKTVWAPVVIMIVSSNKFCLGILKINTDGTIVIYAYTTYPGSATNCMTSAYKVFGCISWITAA